MGRPPPMEGATSPAPPPFAKQSDEEDRLSVLPDDVLLHILVRVDLRTAARTSALSTRWAPLPWLLPELDIDVKDFLSAPHSQYYIPASLMHAAMIALTEATKSLFQRESIITSLRLKLEFADTFSCGIGPLLSDAVDNGLLKDLELAILDETRFYIAHPDILLKRSQQVDGFFRAYPSILHCLTKLSLCDLNFAHLDMNHILFDHCKQLKHLFLAGCDSVSGDCSVWKIDAPKSKLRVLELRDCWFARIELISLPNLEKFAWHIWESETAPLSFGFVPSLQKLCLSHCSNLDQNILKLSKLLHGATGIHTLNLYFRGENIWVQPDIRQLTSAFNKLRKLSVHDIFVEFDLLWITTFLEAAPSIQILLVGVWDHACSEVHRDSDSFPERRSPRWELDFHRSKNLQLKELQILGFRPLEQQLTFIRVILERAPNLQVVVLKEDPCEECNAIIPNAPPCASTHPAYPKNKDEQDMLFRQVTDGTSFSGRILFR